MSQLSSIMNGQSSLSDSMNSMGDSSFDAMSSVSMNTVPRDEVQEIHDVNKDTGNSPSQTFDETDAVEHPSSLASPIPPVPKQL